MGIKRGLPGVVGGHKKLPSSFSTGHKQVSHAPMPPAAAGPSPSYSKQAPVTDGAPGAPPFMSGGAN